MPGARLVDLERDECVQFLTRAQVGRMAVSPPDWQTAPVIRPVNFVFDTNSQSIVFCSARGSKFTALLLSGQASFEIDGSTLLPRQDGALSSTVRSRRLRRAMRFKFAEDTIASYVDLVEQWGDATLSDRNVPHPTAVLRVTPPV
jgi:hypothetical protein